MIKPRVHELDFPDMTIDLEIIARERIRMMKSNGEMAQDEPEPEINPFRCAPRCYLCAGNEVYAMFFPETVDAPMCADAVDPDVGMVECWTLEDDRVIDYEEFTDDGEDDEDEEEKDG
jgi:hypothetical protein